MIQTICDRCGVAARNGTPAVSAVAALPDATPPVVEVDAVPAVLPIIVNHYALLATKQGTTNSNGQRYHEGDFCSSCEKAIITFMSTKVTLPQTA